MRADSAPSFVFGLSEDLELDDPRNRCTDPIDLPVYGTEYVVYMFYRKLRRFISG